MKQKYDVCHLGGGREGEGGRVMFLQLGRGQAEVKKKHFNIKWI